MRLGIMQPYFFPYLGYFDLINCVDRWIVFDTVQYIHHGWVNRNRILHPREGWQYVIVPLKKHSVGTLIKDIQVVNDPNWSLRILGQIQHYKMKAPYFKQVAELIEDCLLTEETSLSRLNVACLIKVCEYLGIQFPYEFFSEMTLELGPVKGPGDWALRISESLQADEYVNLPGGGSIFNSSSFEEAGIKLTLRNVSPMNYKCRGYSYIPNLSMIDLLMWNSAKEIKDYLDEKKQP